MGTWLRYERAWLDDPDKWERIGGRDLEIALRQELPPDSVRGRIHEMDRGAVVETRHARYRRKVSL